MPATGAKMLTMLQNPETSVEEIEDVLRHDPGLTGNLLKLANSAYFGIPEFPLKYHRSGRPYYYWD